MKHYSWQLFDLKSSCHAKLRLNFEILKFKFCKRPRMEKLPKLKVQISKSYETLQFTTFLFEFVQGLKQAIYTRFSIIYLELKRNSDTTDSVVQWQRRFARRGRSRVRIPSAALLQNLREKCRRWAGAGRWGPPPIKKNFHFFGFFSVPTLPSVGHSAKALPSARQKTLGKDVFANAFFAECCLPSAALGGVFAECLLSGTRQSLCRVPDTRQSWNRKKPEKWEKMEFF